MNAPLYYALRSHELDAIVRADCGEAADDNGCAALGQLPEISERPAILPRGPFQGLSQEPGSGQAQEGPGLGYLLPLPDREFHAALELMAPQGVIAICHGAVTPSAPEHSSAWTMMLGWRSPNLDG